MTSNDPVNQPFNSPQPVTWWILNYYPTDADGQTPTEVGALFKTYEDAVNGARTKLATAGVGVCYIQRAEGVCVYNLYEPEPF